MQYMLVLAALLTSYSLPAYSQFEGEHPLHARTLSSIQMTPGMVQIFRTERPVSNVFVGAEEVADVTTISSDTIAITAKNFGHTTLLLLDHDNNVAAVTEIEVTSKARRGRKEVTVQSFGKDGARSTSIHLCNYRLSQAEEGCVPERTSSNIRQIPSASAVSPIIPPSDIGASSRQ